MEAICIDGSPRKFPRECRIVEIAMFCSQGGSIRTDGTFGEWNFLD